VPSYSSGMTVSDRALIMLGDLLRKNRTEQDAVAPDSRLAAKRCWSWVEEPSCCPILGEGEPTTVGLVSRRCCRRGTSRAG
jgi:hypothetical protein